MVQLSFTGKPTANQLLGLRQESKRAAMFLFVLKGQGKNRERRAARNFRQEIYL